MSRETAAATLMRLLKNGDDATVRFRLTSEDACRPLGAAYYRMIVVDYYDSRHNHFSVVVNPQFLTDATIPPDAGLALALRSLLEGLTR